MSLGYFYKNQAEQFAFIRIPRAMMTEEIFAPLSMQAKILYGMLLDRMSEAKASGWERDYNRKREPIRKARMAELKAENPNTYAYSNSLITTKDSREHRDSLLRVCKGKVRLPPAPSLKFEVAICDLKSL